MTNKNIKPNNLQKGSEPPLRAEKPPQPQPKPEPKPAVKNPSPNTQNKK